MATRSHRGLDRWRGVDTHCPTDGRSQWSTPASSAGVAGLVGAKAEPALWRRRSDLDDSRDALDWFNADVRRGLGPAAWTVLIGAGACLALAAAYPPAWLRNLVSPGVHPILGIAFALLALGGGLFIGLRRREQAGIWRLSPFVTAAPLALGVWWLREPLSALVSRDLGVRLLVVAVLVLAGLRWLAEVPIAVTVAGVFLAPDASILTWYAVPALAGGLAVALVLMPLEMRMIGAAHWAVSAHRVRRARVLALAVVALVVWQRGEQRSLAFNRMGSVFVRTEDIGWAVRCRRHAAAIARRRGHTRLEAINLYNLAISQRFAGRLEAALASLSRAGRLSEARAERGADDARLMLGSIGLQQAQVHKDLGDLHAGDQVVDAALTAVDGLVTPETGRADTPTLLLLSDLLTTKSALVLTIRLDSEHSVELLRRSMHFAELAGDRGREVLRLQDLAASLSRLSRFDEAQECLERGLAIADQDWVPTYDGNGLLGNWHDSAIDLRFLLLTRMGMLAAMRGNLERAVHLYREAQAGATVGGFLRIATLITEGTLRQDQGDLAEACRLFDMAVRIADESRIESGMRIAHMAAGKGYEQRGTAADLNVARRHYDRVIDLIESARTSLADEMSKMDFLNVDMRVEMYERMVATCVALGEPAAAFEYAERGKARAMLEHFSDRSGADIQPMSHAATRSMLQDAGGGILLVEYFATHDRVLVIGVREDTERPEVVSVPADRGLMRRFALTNFGNAGRVREMIASGLDELWHGYDDLVAPIQSWARPGESVVLVPHGLLHYLPLHALKVGGQYLIERHPLCYAPSTAVLGHCRQATAHADPFASALVIGDPTEDLPHARSEAQAVAELFGAEPLLGGMATRDAFATAAGQAHLVHYAGHAIFDPGDPMSSGLRLAGEDLLTSREIATMSRMRPALVTLSGCETGVSRHHPGDDVVGLLRGFLYAGAPSVLASLWRVPDESTAFLVTRFYHHLRSTTKANALRQAVLEVRADGKWSSLYHWAPFFLTGDWK